MEAMMVQHAIAAEEPLLQWAVEARALSGEDESGDAYLVTSFDGGALVAAIDGLGHGPEAALAAGAAVAALRRSAGAPIAKLMTLSHDALRRTRGAVVSLASFDRASQTMSWLAVGNVEAVLFRADPAATPPREAAVPRSGVVGYQLPALRVATLPIRDGDTLVLVTDGIRHDFATTSPIGRSPAESAAAILHNHGKATDDALVVVARYRRDPP
jgi:negative regulator of sigma-B (phosphoserine phosphatase)